MFSVIAENSKLFLGALIIIFMSLIFTSCCSSSSSQSLYLGEIETVRSISGFLYESVKPNTEYSSKSLHNIMRLFNTDNLFPFASVLKLRFTVILTGFFTYLVYAANFISGMLFGRYLLNSVSAGFLFLSRIRLIIMICAVTVFSLCVFLIFQPVFCSIAYLMILFPLIPFFTGIKFGMFFFNIIKKEL